jgi:hypothetical protein
MVMIDSHGYFERVPAEDNEDAASRYDRFWFLVLVDGRSERG